MLNNYEKMEVLSADGDQSRRVVNTISVLVPAREYQIDCSWTTEKPLPAVEEFACRLILVMGGVSPSELKGYFGLSPEELEGLVKNLVKNRLVDQSDEGTLRPSSMLKTKDVAEGDIPTFTHFESRQENVVFDLLSLKIVQRRSYSNARFGLPEIPLPEHAKTISADRITEAFSEQTRAFLEFSRGRAKDVHTTRLYKVSRCTSEKMHQVPIDMQISVEIGAGGDLNIYRDAFERLGENRRRALSNELESQVADYLAQELLPPMTSSMHDFCQMVGDEVLARYVRESDFDLASWLSDRDKRKTGYGGQDTTALLGPIYLTNNRITLTKMLSRADLNPDEEGKTSNIAHWLPSDVPFWAANSSELVEFNDKFQRSLGHKDEGRLVACFCGSEFSDKVIKRKFNTRIPHAVLFSGNVSLDRTELLVVPGRLVVAQYHLQPSKASAVTLPIGFVSVNAERVSRITALLKDRLASSSASTVLWSADSQKVSSLVEFRALGLRAPNELKPPAPKPEKGKAEVSGRKIVWKRPPAF